MANFLFVTHPYTSELDQVTKREARLHAIKSFRQKQRDHRLLEPAKNVREDEAQDNDQALIRVNKRGRPKVFSVPQTVHNPQAYRDVLVAGYINDFLPSAWWDDPAAMTTMAVWNQAETPAMLRAELSIGLLHTGSKRKDDQITLHARQTHLAAIQSLKYELSSSKINYDSVLAAALSLFLCEIYSIVSSGNQGLASHMSGATAIVKSIKDHADLAKPSPLLRTTHAHFRHACLFYALTRRTSLPLSARYWQLGAGKSVPGSAEALIRLALRLPDLLECTDCICKPFEARLPNKEGQAICDQLSEIRKELERWRDDFQHSKIASVIPPEEQTQRHQTLQFKSYYEGTLLQIYWILLLLVQHAMLELNASSWSLRSTLYENANANECAGLLVQSIAGICEQAGQAVISKVVAIRAPLHFAMRWYQYSQNDQALKNCRQIESQHREEVSFLNWDSLLPWSFIMTAWLYGLD